MRLIVGLDPGKFWGIALVDLSGRPVHLSTLKNPKKHEIMDEIMRHGHPSIFATDVSSVPSSVRAIASSFGCRVFSPDHDLAVSEKEEAVSGYSPSNLHERDALAAALYAYRKLSGMLERAERASESEKGVDAELVKDLLLRGEASNISEAIKSLKPEVVGNRIVVKVPISTRTVARLKSNLERAERQISMLRKKISDMASEIRELKEENERLRRRRAKKVIVNIDSEETLFSGREGLEEVVVLDDYSRKSLYSTPVSGKVVMVKRNEGSAKLLKKMGPRLVIIDANDFPVAFARPSEANIIKLGDKLYIEGHEVEKLLSLPRNVEKIIKG